MRHITIAQYQAKAEARFWAKVNKTATCWLWAGPTTPKGYGTFTVMAYPNGRRAGQRQEIRAHRYSWELENGPIPDGAEIDHECHAPLCVRPSHLRPTTRKQNGENRIAANSQSKSGVRGVRWVPDKNRWRATVGHDGKNIHVGMFLDLAEAEAAVIAKRKELHTHNNADRTS